MKSLCVVCNYNNAFKYFKYPISSNSIIVSSVTGLLLIYVFIHPLFPNLLNLESVFKWIQSQQL